MSYNPLSLLIGALAVWRLSAMIAYERGPWRVLERLRVKAGLLRYDNGDIDYDLSPERALLISCVWCSSPWIAGLWIGAYIYSPIPTMIVSTVLALSAGAIALEKWNNG